jgi:hypothetical protein
MLVRCLALLTALARCNAAIPGTCRLRCAAFLVELRLGTVGVVKDSRRDLPCRQSPRFAPCRADEVWGYVDVRPGAHMFWWLYGTTAPARETAPLVLWLQGVSETARALAAPPAAPRRLSPAISSPPRCAGPRRERHWLRQLWRVWSSRREPQPAQHDLAADGEPSLCGQPRRRWLQLRGRPGAAADGQCRHRGRPGDAADCLCGGCARGGDAALLCLCECAAAASSSARPSPRLARASRSRSSSGAREALTTTLTALPADTATPQSESCK